MADINAIIDTLSDEEVDLLNSDPELLAAFKAKYGQPTLAEAAGKASKTLLEAPISTAKALTTDPLKVAANPFVLPIAGSLLGGGPGAAAGETVQQIAEQAMRLRKDEGQAPPSPLEVGAKVIGAGIVGLGSPFGAPELGAIRTVGAGKKAVEAAETAAKLKTVPKTFPRGGRGLETFLTQAEDISKSPQALEALGKQGLKNLRQQLGDIIDTGKKAVGKENYAIAAKTKAALTDALNAVVPGRAKAAEGLRTAYQRRNLLLGTAAAGGLGSLGYRAREAIMSALTH